MFKYMMSGMSIKLGNKFKCAKGGLKKVVMNRVRNAIDKIPSESFLKTAQVQDFYSICQVSAEKLDTDS